MAGLVFSLFTIACPGGSKSLYNGKVRLYPESISYYFAPGNSGTVTTLEMIANEGVLDYKQNGVVVLISVAYVKQDEGGVIYSIYKIQTGSTVEYVKINSNYEGNGVRTREIEPTFDISEEIGC